VLIFSVALFSSIVWLIFNPQVFARLGRHPALGFIIGVLSLIPLYPLYRLGRQHPKYFLPMCLLGLMAALNCVAAIGAFSLSVEADWLDYLTDAIGALLVVSSVLMIWKSVRR